MLNKKEKYLKYFKAEIDEIDNYILNNINFMENIFEEALNKLLKGGGKRIRSILLLKFAAFNNNGEKHPDKTISLAAAIEILHMATLVHDDIVDRSLIRRGEPSALADFGEESAIFIGDYFLSKAYRLLINNAGQESLRLINQKLPAICSGEMQEFKNRYNSNITVNTYLKQIRRKSALLFAIATYIGGSESGLSQAFVNKAYRFGVKLGMAFQIQDDIEDFIGGKELNKPVLQDIKNGIYSLPLIYYFRKSSSQLSALELKNLDAEELIKELNKYNIIKEVTLLRNRYYQKAKNELLQLPACSAKKDLEFILDLLGYDNDIC